MSQRVLDILARPDVWASAVAIAGFLALSWLLRGAPIGQPGPEEPAEAPSPSHRDRLALAAVAGFLLVLAGAYLAFEAGIPWSVPAFGAGFALELTVLRTSRKHRHASPTLRRVFEFTGTALTASLLAGILTVANVAAFQYGGRAIDLTRDRAFSLAPQTVRQLQSLDRPVSFQVFFGNAEGSIRQLDRVRQLLELYRAANPRFVRVEYLNPFVDIKEFEALVKRTPGVAASAGDGIVLTYGEGGDAPQLVLGTRELFEVVAPSRGGPPDRYVSSFRGEDVVTSALARLREGKRAKLAFTAGHGEPTIGDLDPSRPGLGLWRARLSSAGIDAVEVDLNRDDPPADAGLIVICGPKTPFRGDELDRLKAFIVRGGQLLILVNNAEPSGLDDLLRTYNVVLGSGMAVDPRYNYLRRAFFVFAPVPTGGNHPVVDPLAGRAILLQSASPLELLGQRPRPGGPPTPSGNPSVIAEPILKTSPSSWSETDPKTRPVTLEAGKDAPGPLVVGAAVSIRPATESERPTPRLVVLSSPLVADNSLIQIEPANLDLVMNAVYWLRGRPELLGIGPKTHESPVFAADPGLRFRLVMVPTLMALVVIVGLGLTTYFARRD